MRNALARLLRGEGYRPVVAATGEEALVLAQDDEFRVVITDLKVMGIGGAALLSRLSPLMPDARFLMLATTGSINTELLPRGHGIRVFFDPFSDSQTDRAVRHEPEPHDQHRRRRVPRVR